MAQSVNGYVDLSTSMVAGMLSTLLAGIEAEERIVNGEGRPGDRAKVHAAFEVHRMVQAGKCRRTVELDELEARTA